MLHSLGKFQGLFRFCTAQAAQARPTPKVAVFSAKVYDIKYFNEINAKLPIENRLKIDFFGEELNEKTAILTRGYDTIIPFVHDKLTSQTIKTLADNGVDLIALRCAGFNNTDIHAAA